MDQAWVRLKMCRYATKRRVIVEPHFALFELYASPPQGTYVLNTGTHKPAKATPKSTPQFFPRARGRGRALF